MNSFLLISSFEDKKNKALKALLASNGEPISLTGLQLSAQIDSIEELNNIITWLVLSGYVQSRTVSDSINGESKVYHLTRKQRDRIADELRSATRLGSNEDRKENKAIFDNVILGALLDGDKPFTLSELCEKEKTLSRKHLSWRVLLLFRYEIISRKRENGDYVYFLSSEQRIRALLNQTKLDPGLLIEDNLREVSNTLLIELSQRESEARKIKNEIRTTVKRIRQINTQLQEHEQEAERRKEDLRLLGLKESEVNRTACFELSEAQKNSVSLSERLSFLRNLQKRPALQGYHLLAEIIRDYELALSLVRSQ